MPWIWYLENPPRLHWDITSARPDCILWGHYVLDFLLTRVIKCSFDFWTPKSNQIILGSQWKFEQALLSCEILCQWESECLHLKLWLALRYKRCSVFIYVADLVLLPPSIFIWNVICCGAEKTSGLNLKTNEFPKANMLFMLNQKQYNCPQSELWHFRTTSVLLSSTKDLMRAKSAHTAPLYQRWNTHPLHVFIGRPCFLNHLI